MITASVYDIFVSVTDRDFLLPDSKFYSVSGWYLTLMFSGYDRTSIPKDAVPADEESRKVFDDILYNVKWDSSHLPPVENETNLFFYIIAAIYSVFGYFPLGVRFFNITLSVLSTVFIYKIAENNFGETPARIFLVVALFLPSQFIYSITLCKDFIRVFLVAFILWILYGGERCLKR